MRLAQWSIQLFHCTYSGRASTTATMVDYKPTGLAELLAAKALGESFRGVNGWVSKAFCVFGSTDLFSFVACALKHVMQKYLRFLAL